MLLRSCHDRTGHHSRKGKGSMEWYLEVMKKYAVFSGRARRKEYWMFFLVNSVISFTIGIVFGFVGIILGIDMVIFTSLSTIYGLATFVPSMAVGVRRMHDIGRSGWWLLFPLVNIVFHCRDSQPTENVYGPNPKAAYNIPHRTQRLYAKVR